jgi:hypothetical protein
MTPVIAPVKDWASHTPQANSTVVTTPTLIDKTLDWLLAYVMIASPVIKTKTSEQTESGAPRM